MKNRATTQLGRALVCALVVGASLLTVAPPVSAASDSTTVYQVPFKVSSSAQADIAACIGEQVTVTGTFNVVRHITQTQFVFHRNVIDGTATGVSTGTVYRATGHIQIIDVTPPSSSETFTYELTLSLVSAGGVGFRAHALEHATVTPQGDLTSWVEIFEITCN